MTTVAHYKSKRHSFNAKVNFSLLLPYLQQKLLHLKRSSGLPIIILEIRAFSNHKLGPFSDHKIPNFDLFRVKTIKIWYFSGQQYKIHGDVGNHLCSSYTLDRVVSFGERAFIHNTLAVVRFVKIYMFMLYL